MTVKELMNFLSKQNPNAKVTLTKDVADIYIDQMMATKKLGTKMKLLT